MRRATSVPHASPSSRATSFLVLLYGTVEYDGRVQRLLDVLGDLGDVRLVDLASEGHAGVSPGDFRRRAVHVHRMAGKLRRHVSFWYHAMCEAVRYRPDVIVSSDFFTTLPGWVCSSLLRRPLLYDAHELIIPEPGEVMGWRDRFWYWTERLAVRRARLVIAASKERAELMRQHYRLDQTPVVMRNIPPASGVRGGEESVLARHAELRRRSPRDTLMLYQGDLSPSRGIDRFVEALDFLESGFRLILVGAGPDAARLRELGRKFEGEGRFNMLGRVEHLLLSQITAMCDVGIVSYPFQGQNNIYCASNKLFEYAMAGLPIVATDQPPLRQLVKDYGIGGLVNEHDSPEIVAKTLRRVVENRISHARALQRLLADHRWEDERARVGQAITNALSQRGCTP